jgi:hypothetical protein
MPALTTLTGEHVASITADHLDGLLPVSGKPRTNGTQPDAVLDFAASVESGRVALYINGQEPRFHPAVTAVFTLTRFHLRTPLFVGISVHDQSPLGLAGVSVVGGWDPAVMASTASAEYLFLRGE